ncbi:MAG TPA: porin PorA family protein [Dehalococcoidales bacterium]|nr:porin PorA family protein [Dehalococcoidales bacterium]
MRLKGWSLGLTTIGLVLVVFALVWLLAIFPSMAKFPADYEQEYTFEGFILQLNSETMSLDEIPTNVVRLLTATGTPDDVLLLKQDVNFYHAEAGILLTSSSEVYGLDRTTRENVSGYGDMDRSGQFTFPAGVEQETYAFWSSSSMTTLPANFVSEETFQGITVYNFKIDSENLDAGTMEGTGLPQTMDVLCEIKVEPVSGIPVYTASTTTVKVPLMSEDPMPIYVNYFAFTSETTDEMVDLAESTSSTILWLSVYGFWIVIAVGAALVVTGVVMAVRNKE